MADGVNASRGAALNSPHAPMAEFKQEIARVVNKYSIDAAMNTPDFIIADGVWAYLSSIIKQQQMTEKWKGQ